jgi:hypothetical protein
MNAPTGLVSARIIRLEQSVDQIRKKEYGGDAANDVIHLMSFTGGRKP